MVRDETGVSIRCQSKGISSPLKTRMYLTSLADVTTIEITSHLKRVSRNRSFVFLTRRLFCFAFCRSIMLFRRTYSRPFLEQTISTGSGKTIIAGDQVGNHR